MSAPLRIAIAGLGTVGAGTLQLLAAQRELLAARAGRELKLVAVSARDRARERGIDISGIQWLENPLAMAHDANIDVVVELIGGSEGLALQLVTQSLEAGKSVVTANKALIAHHGVALAALAEKHGGALAFEAAVAGGIPILKAMQGGLAANRFRRIAGILNGTCNYILSSMEERGLSFEEALAEAQGRGYAEAEPSFDIDGIDTAHKLAILTSLAFGCPPAIDTLYVEGIRHITQGDMGFARELGYTVKLLGICSLEDGGILQRVHPCMVPQDAPLGTVHGVYNAIAAEGDFVGSMFFEGRGAGGHPTASAVVSDLLDIARGAAYRPFTLPVSALREQPFAPMASLRCPYYLRLGVTDRPGVLAEVTGILGAEGISLRSFRQYEGEPVALVLTTHETSESSMQRARGAIARLDSVTLKPTMIRIENP